jgi:hypothetical protein
MMELQTTYIRVVNFVGIEFGYYEFPDCGCADEFKVVARHWVRESNFLDEMILTYADSEEEALGVVKEYLKKGVTFTGFYGEFNFPGGYHLINFEDHFTPLCKESFIELQTNRLLNCGVIDCEHDIVMAVISKVLAFYEQVDLSRVPIFKEQKLDDRTSSLRMSWSY